MTVGHSGLGIRAWTRVDHDWSGVSCPQAQAVSSVQCQASLLPTVTTRNRRQQRKQGSKLDRENRQLRPRKQMYASVSLMLLHFKLAGWRLVARLLHTAPD